MEDFGFDNMTGLVRGGCSVAAEARQALFGYIDGYYNRHRMHSAVGYLTSEQAEERMSC